MWSKPEHPDDGVISSDDAKMGGSRHRADLGFQPDPPRQATWTLATATDNYRDTSRFFDCLQIQGLP
jgi:hypothetical protein